MEKAMQLKGNDAVEVFLTVGGKIAIRQDCAFGESESVFLTLDQFAKIEDWIFKNKDEIVLAWNEGVEDDSKA